VAPPGTRSALFSLSSGAHGVAHGVFDDVDVEDAVVADSIAPETTLICPPYLAMNGCDELSPDGASASFYFDASEQSSFECSLDDREYAPCSSAGFAPVSYSGLSDGLHTFRVRAIDRAGNTDPTPAEQTWTVTPPGFSIEASPSRVSVMQGTGADAFVQTTQTSGPPDTIDLTAEVQPAGRGVTASFSPSTIWAGSRAYLGVGAAADTPPGDYTITVIATGTRSTHTTTLTVTVTSADSPTPSPTPTPTPTSRPTPTPTFTPSPTPTPSPTGCAAGNGTDVQIPDLSTVESAITISGCPGNASGGATVDVHIVHTYIGDLIITLVAPDGSTHILQSRAGGSADNIDQTYIVNLSSEPADGIWRLRVQDAAAADVGRIDSWTIDVDGPAPTPSQTPTPTSTATPGTPTPTSTPPATPTPTPGSPGCAATNSSDVPVPDLSTVESPITIVGCPGNASASATVEVHIVHTYIGDLIVTLIAADGSTYVLHNRAGGSTDNIDQTYTVNLSPEPANGTWRLRVQDAAAVDVGRIDSWTLNLGPATPARTLRRGHQPLSATPDTGPSPTRSPTQRGGRP
jgi:subtilisin-like proprotein convertase family protein